MNAFETWLEENYCGCLNPDEVVLARQAWTAALEWAAKIAEMGREEEKRKMEVAA